MRRPLRAILPSAVLLATIILSTTREGAAVAAAPKSPAPAGAGLDQAAVQKALRQEIVGNTLPLAQWQRFCDERVPRMKSFASAAAWQAEADRLRAEVLQKVVYRGAAAGWRDAPARVEWLGEIPGGPGYRIKRLRYQALPGLWIPALLYEPERLSGKVPAVMNVNGHDRPLGKALPYKQIRCINQAKRGILALNVEWLGMGQLGGDNYSHGRSDQLNLCGTNGVSVFFLSMKRGLDLLVSLEHTDPTRLAVTGLSGGGWQTIFISSLDPRVTLCNPVAGYSGFLTRSVHLKDLGDSEQTPCDLGTVADYTHLTAMLAPRAALLTFNSKDNCCFESVYALEPLLDAARPIYKLVGRPEALRSHVNDVPGTHNYEQDNRQAFYGMLGDFFFTGDKRFDPREIPSDAEVKTKKDLEVELPQDNADFHSLALGLAAAVPSQSDPPTDLAGRAEWQATQRRRLAEIVRPKNYAVDGAQSEEETAGPLHIRRWKLHIGPWTVPAVDLCLGDKAPGETVLVLGDKGRQVVAAEVAALLDGGARVVAVDPLGIGESLVFKRAELPVLLIATVGERALGLQASQITAVRRWLAGGGKTPIRVVALGPRTTTAALVAAALDPDPAGRFELRDGLASFRDILQRNWSLAEAPELFCFDLLKGPDVRQLAALSAPSTVVFAASASTKGP